MKTFHCAFVAWILAGIIIPKSATLRPNQMAIRPGECPPTNSILGTCIFDPDVNCYSDAACKDPSHKCCREGCNKVCKAAVHNKFMEGYLNLQESSLAKWDWSWIERAKAFIQNMLNKFWEVAA